MQNDKKIDITSARLLGNQQKMKTDRVVCTLQESDVTLWVMRD